MSYVKWLQGAQTYDALPTLASSTPLHCVQGHEQVYKVFNDPEAQKYLRDMIRSLRPIAMHRPFQIHRS